MIRKPLPVTQTSKITAFITGLWEKLILPHPSIQETERRRRVRALSSLHLSILVLGGATLIWKLIGDGPLINIPISAVTLIVIALAYVLSRSKYYKIASALTILAVWGSSISGSIIDQDPQTLYFMIFSASISSLFLSPIETMLVSVLSAGLIFFLPAVSPLFNFSNIINPAFMVILSGGLASVAASVQLQDFRHIMRQSHDLSTNIQELIHQREALQRSEVRLSNILENAAEGIVALDESQNIILFNKGAEKIFGYKAEEVVGKPLQLLLPERFAKDHHKHVQTFGGTSKNNRSMGGRQEVIGLRKQGTEFPAQIGISSHTENEQIIYTAILVDITDQVQAEKARQATETRYRTLFDRIPIALYRTTPQGEIIEINPALVNLLGFPDGKTLKATNVSELYVDPEQRVQENALLVREGMVYDVQFQLRCYDGSLIWVRDTSRIVEDVDGAIYYEGSLENITQRKRAEKLQSATYQISQSAVSTKSTDELYASIHHILGELMPAENFYIALFEPASDTLSFPYFVDQFDLPPNPRKAGHGLTEYVLCKGSALLASREWFNQVGKEGEVESIGTDSIDWLGVPLKTENRVIGVMAVQSYTEGIRYDQENVDLLEFVSTQVGLAIERKQTDRELQLNSIRSGTLAEISHLLVEVGLDYQAILDSVTRRVATLVGDACGIALLSDDKTQIILASLYHPRPEMIGVFRELVVSTNQYILDGIIGGILQTGQPLLMDNVSMEQINATLAPEYQSRLEASPIHGFLIVPMRAQGRVIGTLGITHSQPGQSFENGDQVFLQEIADRAALAVVNAQLYERAQRSLSKVQALRQIDIAITGSGDLRISLGTILEQVISQMGVDAANILILNARTLTLDYAAGKGFRTDSLQHTHLRLGEGYSGRAALERRIIKIQDLASHQTDFLRSLFFIEESFVTYFAVPLIAKGMVKGVLEIFHRSSLNSGTEWMDFLEALAGQAAIAIDNASLFNDLQQLNQELILAYDATIEGWSHALDLRDNETEGHTQRVTEITGRLARVMGISDAELVHVRRGALLHDIGKMGIPDKILLKPGPLSDDEWVIMRKHPKYAYEMLAPIQYLRPAVDIPYCHHEKWDGTGYPRGLKGEQIPLVARVFAVVDVWDALTSNRPYRAAWSNEKALTYIRELAGIHFDPEVVVIFLEFMQDRLKP